MVHREGSTPSLPTNIIIQLNNKHIMENEYHIRRENAILKCLLKNGFFWMNYSSRDCDGCYEERAIKFTNLEEFYKKEEDDAEWADGPFSYSVAIQYPDGSFDLVDDHIGGSW